MEQGEAGGIRATLRRIASVFRTGTPEAVKIERLIADQQRIEEHITEKEAERIRIEESKNEETR